MADKNQNINININTNADQAKKSVDALDKSLDNVNKSNTDLGTTSKKTSTQLAGQEAIMGKLDDVSGGLASRFGSITESLGGLTKGLGGLAAGIAAAVAAIVLGVKAVIDYNLGLKEMNNQLKSFGVTSKELSGVRSEIQATADQFDLAAKDIASSLNTISKAYGTSFTEANNILIEGLAKGGQANEDFLNQIKEYSVQFKNAGFSAQEFINIINAGSAGGVFGDKLPDAIKEAGLALNEATQATQDALTNAFGKDFTGKLLTGVSKGVLSVKEALELVDEQAKKTGLTQQQQAQLTADLFKGAGEDAGGLLVILDNISKANQKASKDQQQAIDDAKELNTAYADLNKATADLFEIVGFQSAWTAFKVGALDALTSVLKALKPIGEGFGDLWVAVFGSEKELDDRLKAQIKRNKDAVADAISAGAQVAAAGGGKKGQSAADKLAGVVAGPTKADLDAQKAAAKKAQAERERQAEQARLQLEREAQERAKFVLAFNAKLAQDELNAQAETAQEKFNAERLNERRALEASLKALKFGNDEKKKLLKQFDDETALEQAELNKKLAIENSKSLAKANEDNIKARLDQIDFDKAKNVEELNLLVEKNVALLQELRDFNAEQIELENITDEEKKVRLETNNADYITAVQGVADSEVAVKEDFVTRTQEYNQQLMDSAQAVFDNAATLAGAETDLGKALLVAKQAAVAAELILNIKSMISNSQKVAADATVKAAGAGVDIATGAAKTASAAPFPANIPLIVGYAATAIGIFASIKAALKKTKGAQDPGSTDAGAGAAAPAVASAPSVSYLASNNNQLANTIQSSQQDQVVKAYVVSGDMTNQQSLDRNLVESTSI